MGYEILKIYNNNVVLAMQNGESVILVSKGIGFGKKIGQMIESNHSIEKVFHEINPNEKFLNIKESNESYNLQETVDKLMEVAQIEMGPINMNMSKVLIEHIQFALQRIEMGLIIENPFIEEIISLYPKEFEIAGTAVRMIKDVTGIEIGEEERGFIALHLRSARDNRPIRDTLKRTRMYKQCVEMIENQLNKKINLRTKKSKAFLNNLEVLIDIAKKKGDLYMPIKMEIKEKLPRSYEIADEISEFIKVNKQICLTDDLVAYLAIEIEKLNN